MKPIRTLVTALVLCVASAPALAQQEEAPSPVQQEETSGLAQPAEAPGTLRELVVYAVATHEFIERADSDIRRSEADVRLASSALLPNVELNGVWTRFRDEQSVEFAPGEDFIIRPLTDWSWSADISQRLFAGLRAWRLRNIARLNLDASFLDRMTVANDLTLQVSRVFYEAVATAERVDVERTALEQIEEQLRVTQRRFEVGEVASAEVARWRAEVAASKQALVVAEGDAELSRRRLARFVNLPEVGELKPPGPIPVPPGSDNDLIVQAHEQRLEMKTLKNQLEAAGLQIKFARGAWYPELDANLQYFQQKSEFPSQDWASLGLTVRVPIYDGGFTKARVAQTREDLFDVQLLDFEVRKRIADQVDSAAITYRAATAALEAARERTIAAREAYRQVERAYRVGESSSLDLLDATTEAIDAETTHIIARNQREFQAIALRHAVGMTPLPDYDPTARFSEDGP